MLRAKSDNASRARQVVAAVWAGSGVGWLLAGAGMLYLTLRSGASELGPSAAGLVTLCGAAQLDLLRRAKGARLDAWLQRAAWRPLLACLAFGLTAAFMLALSLPQSADRPWAFLAGAALVFTALAAWIGRMPIASTKTNSAWRRVAAALGAATALVWMAEGALRIHDRASEPTLEDAYALRRMKPFADPKRYAALRSGSLRRVIVLGDEALADGDGTTSLVDALAARYAGMAWTDCARPGAGPAEYAALVATRLDLRQRDVLLLCVSAADDQLQRRVDGGFFDRSSWKLWQAAVVALGARAEAGDDSRSAPPDPLTRELEALAACQVEPDLRVEAAWRENRRAVARIVEQARAADVEVIVAVMPEPFQVDPARWQRLVRGSGQAPEAFDARLPQHRWTTLAVDLGVPLVDLCPRPTSASADPQVVSARLAAWLDHHFGRAPAAPESAVVSRK